MATAMTETRPCASLNSYSELLTDICKFSNLNGLEKQELLGMLDEGSFDGRHILQSLTRKQLKNYLNFRTGVDKTFTSYSKCKLIDRLVKTLLVNSAFSSDNLANNAFLADNMAVPSIISVSHSLLNATRRLRKGKHPTRLPNFAGISSGCKENNLEELVTCQNVACRAKISSKHSFCKRCSCCLCHRFDDNKDPSLWITCEQDSASSRQGCGLSCHLECALNRKMAGVVRAGRSAKVDGGYRCQSCGNVSELLGCWKKQLVIAKEARRVDVLCHRLSLAHQLLEGTSEFIDLHVNVHIAAQNLEKEIGPFNEASNKLVRGIVGRLSVASLVQKNIEKALTNFEMLKTMPKVKRDTLGQELLVQDPVKLHLQKVSSISFTLVLEVSDKTSDEEIAEHEVWHRKVNQEFGNSPTFSVPHKDLKGFFFSDLEATTEYVVRVVTTFTNGTVMENEASCSTKSLEQRNGYSAIATAKTNISPISMVDKALYELDDITSTFKVRNIGKILKAGALADVRNTESKLLSTADNRSSTPMPSDPTDFNNNKLEKTADLSPEADSFEGRGTKQKLSYGLVDLPFKSCSNIRSHNSALNVLVQDSEHSIPQLDSGNELRQRQFAEIPQSRLMADKFPVANDMCSFVYVQPPKQAQFDILQLKCSSPNMMANVSQCLSIDQCFNHIQQNAHSVELIVHSDVDRDVTKMEPQKKSRKRLATDQQRSCDKLEPTCQHELSAPETFHAPTFEYYVSVLRWLEHQGRVGAHFRKRFLSWLGVRATDQQTKVIDAYIKVMISEPESLAEQLIDTYEEIISMVKQKAVL